MKPRPLTLALVLAAAALVAWLGREHAWTAALENWYVDFLVANARERFEGREVAPSEDVVFIEFSEKDKAEYKNTWPPAPIDYIMVLKRLAGHDPDVVAFTDVLKWDQAGIQFVDELQQALVKFPQVALAFSAVTGATAESGLINDDAAVPTITGIGGDALGAPALSRLNFPDPKLSMQMQLGFVASAVDQPGTALPLLVARADTRLVPSLAAQMIALKSRAPYAFQRLRFGVGAGLYLGDGRFIPLAPDGSARPRTRGDLTRINALELLAPDLGNAAAKETSTRLGSHKLVIIGRSPSAGEIHARLAAWALELPELIRTSNWVAWILAAFAAALAFGQSRLSRAGVLISGACAGALLLGAALLVFQASLTWWPPLPPVVILFSGTLFCLLWRRDRDEAALAMGSFLP